MFFPGGYYDQILPWGMATPPQLMQQPFIPGPPGERGPAERFPVFVTPNTRVPVSLDPPNMLQPPVIMHQPSRRRPNPPQLPIAEVNPGPPKGSKKPAPAVPRTRPNIGRSIDLAPVATAKPKRRRTPKKLVPSIQSDERKCALQYLESILHPERGLPVGIPDQFTYPFTPMSLVSKFTLTSDASGNCLVVCQPYIQEMIRTHTSTAGLWNSPSIQNAAQAITAGASLIEYRPVSFGASFTSTQAALTAAGEGMVGVSGTGTMSWQGQPVTTAQTGLIEWERCGLNKSEGCRAIWFPRSPSDRMYSATAVPPLAPGELEGNGGVKQRGSSTLVFAFTGLPVSTVFGFIETTLNIEGITVYGENFLTKKRTYVDTPVMDMVSNVIASTSQITSYQDGKRPAIDWDLDEVIATVSRGIQTASTVGSLLAKAYAYF